jgi:hypothetical protein
MTQNQRRDAGDSASSAPDFDPVPVRARRDGWTPERQRAFIAALRATLSISKAARAVGMSRKSAYRLRERPDAESFAAAWDKAFALRPPRGPTSVSLLWHRALYGVTRPIYRGGKQIGTVTTPDDQALLKLCERFERKERAIQRRRALLGGDGRSQ